MKTRSRPMLGLIVVVLGAIAIAVATFPLWRPFFVDDVVNEAFPAEFGSLSTDEQAVFIEMLDENEDMAVAMVEAAVGPDAEVPEAEQAMPSMPDGVILSAGQFIEIDAVHGASGTATIYQLGDGSNILRLENFRVTNGPELHVILSAHADPRSRSDVGQNMVDLGRLTGNVGDQNYEIPAGLDLSAYNSVVVYCVPFHVVFSTATLGG